MKKYNISLASYSFHGALSEGRTNVFAYLESIKYRYNVDFADIWTGFLPALDETFLKAIRRNMDDRGICLANLCVDGPHLWENDPEKRIANKKNMLEYIKAAEILGARTIRVDFGGSEGYTMPDEAFEYIVGTYREYCAICANLGIKIGPENHWGWDRVPEYLVKVREAVNNPYYGHLFHFGNFFDGKKEEGLAAVLPYAMHTHIPADSLIPQEDGISPAEKYIPILAASGYSGTYSVEHHSGQYEFERVEAQLGQVRTIIAKQS